MGSGCFRTVSDLLHGCDLLKRSFANMGLGPVNHELLSHAVFWDVDVFALESRLPTLASLYFNAHGCHAPLAWCEDETNLWWVGFLGRKQAERSTKGLSAENQRVKITWNWRCEGIDYFTLRILECVECVSGIRGSISSNNQYCYAPTRWPTLQVTSRKIHLTFATMMVLGGQVLPGFQPLSSR